MLNNNEENKDKLITFVYGKNKLDFKKYIKTVNGSNVDVISFHDIVTKLIKNDSNNDRPSDIVVNSYLRKKILKSINDNSVDNIIYALKDIESNVIESIHKLFKSECRIAQVKSEYEIIIINHKKINIEDLSINDNVGKIITGLKVVEL